MIFDPEAKNEHELREKLAKTLENALLDKQIDEVTITTEVYHGNKIQSTQVTKFDASTPNGVDDTSLVTIAKGNDITQAVTSSATRSTAEVRDVTTTTVLESVFTTRSITSVASTKSLKKSTSTKGKCDVTYNLKCFQVIIGGKCDNNSSDANIYNVEHLNLLKDYLRPMVLDGRASVTFRTGMTYKKRTLYSTTGQVMSLQKETWAANNPNPSTSRTAVGVLVFKNPSDSGGICNTYPSWAHRGVICENDLLKDTK
ncbi:uncharacterized protein LOC120340077 [Styela clava]